MALHRSGCRAPQHLVRTLLLGFVQAFRARLLSPRGWDWKALGDDGVDGDEHSYQEQRSTEKRALSNVTGLRHDSRLASLRSSWRGSDLLSISRGEPTLPNVNRAELGSVSIRGQLRCRLLSGCCLNARGLLDLLTQTIGAKRHEEEHRGEKPKRNTIEDG
jgi:hypothetical protein